jgi:hypothetical protein
MRRLGAALGLAAALVAAPAISPESSRSAGEKIERLANLEAAPGSHVILTQDEINSYLRYDFASQIPAGITDPDIRLDADRVTGHATVDFAEWQAAKGKSPGMLMGLLLRGQRRIEVVCHYTSANGSGRVDIESVRIANVSVSPAVVNFLMEEVVQPRYPAAVAGRPAPLDYNLRQVKIEPGRAVFVLR